MKYQPGERERTLSGIIITHTAETASNRVPGERGSRKCRLQRPLRSTG